MVSMNDIKIKRGSIFIYRLFDVAFEIDLSLVESKIKKGVKRLTLSKIPYMKAIEFTNPPVSIKLKSFKKELLSQTFSVMAIAKAYDFGVISLSMELPIPVNGGRERAGARTAGPDPRSGKGHERGHP